MLKHRLIECPSGCRDGRITPNTLSGEYEPEDCEVCHGKGKIEEDKLMEHQYMDQVLDSLGEAINENIHLCYLCGLKGYESQMVKRPVLESPKDAGSPPQAYFHPACDQDVEEHGLNE